MRMSSSRLLGGRFRALSDSWLIWLFCLCSGFNLYISTPCSCSHFALMDLLLFASLLLSCFVSRSIELRLPFGLRLDTSI